MCYFEQTRWSCGYWRWGYFRRQCNKEYRMGETCGLKLVYETKTEPDKCKLCHDTEKKQRRYDKMYRDVQRWHRESNRTTAIERTFSEMSIILGQIYRMREEHEHRILSLGDEGTSKSVTSLATDSILCSIPPPEPRQELNPPASAEAHDDVIQLTPTRDADAEPEKEDNDDLWGSLETHNMDKKTNKDQNPEPELLESPSPAELENEAKKKPHDMPLWPNNEFKILSSRNQEGSARSQSESSIFDRGDRSRATLLTTVATSLSRTKYKADPGGPIVTTPGMGMEAEQPNLSPETKDACTDNSDAETSYSLDTMVDDPTTFYLQAFSDQLSSDLGAAFNYPTALGIEPQYIESVLKKFAWKLHGESSNPFQWETSVTLHRNRKDIVELLSRTAYVEGSVEAPERPTSVSEIESGDEKSERELFQRSTDMILDWLSEVRLSAVDGSWREDPSSSADDVPLTAEDELSLFQFADYEEFVRNSDAYRWLLSKIQQHKRLRCGSPDSMSEIGTKVLDRLRAQTGLRKLSRRGPSSAVTMIFNLDWDPASILHDQGLDLTPSNVLERVLCLTGTLCEAQATTVIEYMTQTWPETGEPIITLIKKLLSLSEGEECFYQLPEPHVTQQHSPSGSVPPPKPNSSQLHARIDGPSLCSIRVTGGPQFVSEIAEQLGWLASTLRRSPAVSTRGVVSCTPSVKDIQIKGKEKGDPTVIIEGSCRISFDFKQDVDSDIAAQPKGFCWGRLFLNPILVRGYPILRRPEPNTGLEISIRAMASLIRSHQVVQWDERILMKGFSSLVVATLVTAGVTVWHMLVSENPENRISYIDPALDKLTIRTPKGFSLRSLEGSRHILGWCANATNMCGHGKAELTVRASGLRKPPASIVIDRLYLEGGMDFVGGVNMSINKKEQPFWLEREKDYPSLLKWASLQPIIFYDASDRRAWLVDGASAILHLVRISLYLDEHDPESTYDWVFDLTQLKDKWDGCTGRLAALKTLKSWDNLNLNLYISSKRVRHGQVVTEFSTLETRVKNILHSLEILVDRQVKVASQDGVRISQSLDPRASIVGFDILDVITPLGPVHPRIQHIDSWGSGWRDLAPAVGITTIFGSDFGDLIRPDDPSGVCSKWRSVPTGLDYMAASVSTLKTLHEQRLTRMEPGLGIGELTRKIVWLSPCELLKPCGCTGGGQVPGTCRLNPVQFLVPKRTCNLRFMSRPMRLVDVMNLNEKGAVIFGHMPLLGLGRDSKDAGQGDEVLKQGEQSIVESTSTSSQWSGQGRLSPSAVGSTTDSTLTRPSTRAVPSGEMSRNDDEGSGETQREESGVDNTRRKSRERKKKWMNWTRR